MEAAHSNIYSNADVISIEFKYTSESTGNATLNRKNGEIFSFKQKSLFTIFIAVERRNPR